MLDNQMELSQREIASRMDRIQASLSGFLATIADPELVPAVADSEVCDFLVGNPQELASPRYVETLQRWADPEDRSWFAYKGPHRPAQEAAAAGLSRELGLDFAADDILLARGAHGALGLALQILLDPGDEVIFVSPPWFFYEAMILGSGGVPVRVRADPATFDLDLDAIARAITPRTRALLLNTPNNPTGRIYPQTTLAELARQIEAASDRNRRPIHIVSDEAYSRILFDGNRMVSPAAFYPRTLLVHTYSKTALAPGQRLGYVALPPGLPGREEVREAVVAAGFASGNLLPDAIMQYALADIEAIEVDIIHLQRKRDRMVDALRELGYELHIPEATFYLLPRSPIANDVAFARRLAVGGVRVLPGRVVEMPGHFRISLTATDQMIDRAIPVFASARQDISPTQARR